MFKNYVRKKRRARNCYLMITGPAMAAIKLLEEFPHDPGLNLGAVRRNLDWCFSTYNYVGGDLTKAQQKSVETLLGGLQNQVADFDWVAAGDKATDGWDEAMIYYNDRV